MRRYVINFIFVLFIILSCTNCKNRVEYIITPERFKNSPEYELAVAVFNKNTKKIDEICLKHPEFIERSYSDSYYSVLHWACEANNYIAAKELLQLGMNPNVALENGETPLYTINESVAVFPPQDLSQICLLLISYGADCNIRIEHDWADNEPDLYGETPFMYAATLSNKNIKKIMIENGADINAKTRSGITATVRCLLHKEIDYAYFLICECKADVTNEFYFNKNNPELIKPVSLLRTLIYPLNSEKYKLKLKIIDEFKNQGINYYDEPVPENIIEKIKKIYPDSWEDYIKVY